MCGSGKYPHQGWASITTTLSSAEASYFFVLGEVKSKRMEPGENRNESARGTLGREKERLPLLRLSRRPPRFPYFSLFVFFAFPH